MTLHTVKLVWITENAEQIIAHCARVSSKQQNNDKIVGLLKYCMREGHWSIFEMASMCVEVTTTLPIAVQLLRHKSMSFQMFSQRYANPMQYSDNPLPSLIEAVMVKEWRLQDAKNRQASIEPTPAQQVEFTDFTLRFKELALEAIDLYEALLAAGIAKECARDVLPIGQPTRLYATAPIRSWLTYCKTRELSNGTQKEHAIVAKAIDDLIKERLPIVWEASKLA